MASTRRLFDENDGTNNRDDVCNDILARAKAHLTPRASAFADPLTTTSANARLSSLRRNNISTLDAYERDHGRAGANAGEIDHVTPVLAPGGALARTSPWSERAAYARAHPYAIPPRRLGLFDDIPSVSGRDRVLGRPAATTTEFGRDVRREAVESWRRPPSVLSSPRTFGEGLAAYRGYIGASMGGVSSGLRDRCEERALDGANFKRYERIDIFGEALKKYVNTKKWDDAQGLSNYKALIASFEQGTLSARAHRVALESEHSKRREGVQLSTESLSAKHAATIRDMQESLRLRREKLSQVLSSSTSGGLEEDLERLTIEAAEHKARREREKAAKKFLKPLTAHQLQAVERAFGAPDRAVLAKASFIGQGALEATGRDIATLKKGTWLNDEVSNFAIGMLSRRVMESMPDGSTQPKAHFFSTFFINKLYQDSGRYDYSNVRRWTLPKKLKYDVLRCEKIYVPVHQAVHWVLVEIDVLEKRISYFDSLLGESAVTVKNLKRWIVDEAKNKLNEDWDPDEWEEYYPKNIPLQKNGCDCGVFMIKFAEYLSSGAELAFSQKHMDYFRFRLVSDMLEVGVTEED